MAPSERSFSCSSIPHLRLRAVVENNKAGELQPGQPAAAPVEKKKKGAARLPPLDSRSSLSRHAEGKFTIPRPPPDFTNIPSEKALLHKYDLASNTWCARSHFACSACSRARVLTRSRALVCRSSVEVRVKIERTPFGRGSLRVAHHMSGLDPDVTGAFGLQSRRFHLTSCGNNRIAV